MSANPSENDLVAEKRRTDVQQDVQMSGEALRCWLRFTNVPFSPRFAAGLLKHFNYDAEAIFSASDAELDEAPQFQSRHLVRLRDPAYQATDRQAAWFEKYGVRLLLPHHREYPLLLHTISDPPAFLCVSIHKTL